MRRSGQILVACLLVISASGCSTMKRSVVYRPTLLFDNLPGMFTAERYVGRELPTSPAFLKEGEQIYYREYFVDRQGDPFGFGDHFTRRFTTIREGYGRR